MPNEAIQVMKDLNNVISKMGFDIKQVKEVIDYGISRKAISIPKDYDPRTVAGV